MKFEKFLKSVGTHGLIYKRGNGDRWLLCGGVGMIIPTGVDNLLGAGEVSERIKNFVDSLIEVDTDDKVVLTRAEISADGKAKDIIRVFSDDLTIEVGIYNSDFGLLEKSDTDYLCAVEIEDDDIHIAGKYLLILNRDDEIVGFIKGTNNI